MTPIDSTQATPERTMPVNGEQPQPGTDTTASSSRRPGSDRSSRRPGRAGPHGERPTVLERRYLIRDEAGEVVESPRQLFWRVARTVAKAELAYDAEPAEALEVARDFYTLMSQRMFLPNSPCLTNAGRGSGMLSACFVLPVEDSVESIYDAVKATALIQKAGGGTGFSFSKVREAGDRVEGTGGHGAGPLTFMEVFSKASDSITQERSARARTWRSCASTIRTSRTSSSTRTIARSSPTSTSASRSPTSSSRR